MANKLRLTTDHPATGGLEGITMHIVNEGNGMYGIERNGRRVVTGESYQVVSNICEQATQGLPSECEEVQESLLQPRIPRVRYEGISSQGHVFISVDGNAGAIDCGPATPETIRLARVMAAGMELLEALTQCAHLLEIANIAGKSTYASGVRMRACAAIAKAKGK